MARKRHLADRRARGRFWPWLAWFAPVVSAPAEARLGRRAVALALVVALWAIAHVWARVRVQDLSRRLVKTENVLHALDIEHQELIDQEARLSAPDKILNLAHMRLGLRRPLPGQVISLDAGTGKNATKP